MSLFIRGYFANVTPVIDLGKIFSNNIRYTLLFTGGPIKL
jgi:hypothetical protein